MQALLLHHPPEMGWTPRSLPPAWQAGDPGGMNRHRSIAFPDGERCEIKQKGNK